MDAIERDPGRPRIESAVLQQWMVRRDGPGLARATVQLIVLLVSLAAATKLGAMGNPGWVLAIMVAGVALLAAFPAMHEAGHGTAFATAGLNRVVLGVGAFLMLMAPTFFREFHWQHHRKTQDPAEDPEIAGAPALLDGWPTNPVTYIVVASGQTLLVGKPMFTLAAALLPSASAWDRLFPYVRASKRRRVAWESRAVIVVWGLLLLAGFRFVDGFAYALLAWPVGHLLLGLYIFAEHTGLPHEGTQLERTRTVVSNAAVRWWMWNMPLHTAHHAFPAVPFHALPMLHAEIEAQLPHISPSYASVHRTALGHAFGRAARTS